MQGQMSIGIWSVAVFGLVFGLCHGFGREIAYYVMAIIFARDEQTPEAK
jgi:hypothetical protein